MTGFVLLIAVGLSLLTSVTFLKSVEQKRLRSSLVAYRLTFPQESGERRAWPGR